MDHERLTKSLTGAVALLLAAAVVVFGVKFTNGDLKPVYFIDASFDSAGQGLQSKSDVKVHGVNVGTVKNVKLVNGRALVRLQINKGQKIPVNTEAVIRPKTLFGEKFVDLSPGTAQQETAGPFLRNGQTINDTLGGFELEKVLADAYPILTNVKPEDLTTVLDTLAQAGAGEGPVVNHAIGNFQKLNALGVAHNADTQRFLDDFSLLSQELAARAGDLVALAKSLNSALPPLNQRGDEVSSILDNLSRLSNDAADLLDKNRPFQDKAFTEGSKSLTLLAGRSDKIGPLVHGLVQYLQFQAIVGHIPYGDGTNLAAVKLVLGGGCLTGQNTCQGGLPLSLSDLLAPPPTTPAAATTPPPPAPTAAAPSPPVGPTAPFPLPLPQPQTGNNAILNLLQGLLR
jgi:phospholipid/cholesterol/gamma-HCH transport system substrate-binding protein